MASAPRTERPRRRRVVLAVAALALAGLTGYPLCDAAFDCGCTWPLLGGDAHCDIHRAGPPDCPACARPAVGAAFFGGLAGAWGLVLAGGAAVAGRLRRMRP